MGVGADVPMVSTEGTEVSEVDEERAGIVERTLEVVLSLRRRSVVRNASCRVGRPIFYLRWVGIFFELIFKQNDSIDELL